jgi:cyclohexanone monooxygenase
VPAHNAPLDAAQEARIKPDYAGFRARNRQMLAAFGSEQPRGLSNALQTDPAERQRCFNERWRIGGLTFNGACADLMLDERANGLAADYVRARIREQVCDPMVAERLMPRQPIGCKRLCVDTGYYQSFNRPNVRLVDIADGGIERITPQGLRAAGEDFRLDSLVYATGFDAMTGSLDRIQIRGRGGCMLRELWRAGPCTYLGLGVAGMPNLFLITGPGSPSVLTNMWCRSNSMCSGSARAWRTCARAGCAASRPTKRHKPPGCSM